MAEVLHVSEQEFDKEILEADGPVLVDFWAEWCGPCRMMAPVLDDIAREYVGRLKVAKLNVDENPNAAAKYGVMSIPTLVLFKNGKEERRIVGYTPREKLKQELEPLLNG